MKLLPIFIAVPLAICSISAWAGAEVLHGTGLQWGMSQAQVEQTLHTKVMHGEAHTWDEYAAFGNFDGLPARYVFGFYTSTALSTVIVVIDRPASADQQHEFDGMKSKLAFWYGEPVADIKRDGSNDVLYTVWTPAENRLEFGSGTNPTTHLPFDMINVERRLQPEDAVTVSAKELATIADGEVLKVKWAEMPVVVVKRSTEDMEQLKKRAPDLKTLDGGGNSSMVQAQSYERPLSLDEAFVHTVYRSQHPAFGVYLSFATDFGCSLLYKDLSAIPDAQGMGMGFYDPCHGHTWDTAGWPQEPGPGITPLAIPKYHFESNGDLVIGR